MAFVQLNQSELKNKKVLTREDLNVPTKIVDGKITITSRFKLKACLDNIKDLIKAGSKIAIMTHFGRPKEGKNDPAYSVEFLAQELSKELGFPVLFEPDYLTKAPRFSTKHILLFENVRFNKGESTCSDTLTKKYASLCDVFIFNAFAVAQRSHSSTLGLIKNAPKVGAGPLVRVEVDSIENFKKNNSKPICAIIGGSKISTKFKLLESLITKVDHLIVGGGIANTFLAAQKINIGKSLHEKDGIDLALKLLSNSKQCVKIVLPTDVIVASYPESRLSHLIDINKIQKHQMILDLGPKTLMYVDQIIHEAKQIIWNGPIGMIEKELFCEGTKTICESIANSNGYSLAGGGETILAIEKYKATEKIDYISTGGGAFIESLETTNVLPCIQALTK